MPQGITSIHEANYTQGKKDFISKLEIALKEASKILNFFAFVPAKAVLAKNYIPQRRKREHGLAIAAGKMKYEELLNWILENE